MTPVLFFLLSLLVVWTVKGLAVVIVLPVNEGRERDAVVVLVAVEVRRVRHTHSFFLRRIMPRDLDTDRPQSDAFARASRAVQAI